LVKGATLNAKIPRCLTLYRDRLADLLGMTKR
jgi:hypothetical protein